MHFAGPCFVSCFFASLLLGILVPTSTSAQWSHDQREQLAGQLESAAKNLDPTRFPQVAESTENVRLSITAVETFFSQLTDTANGAGWLAYLDLGPLRQAITSEDSPATIAREAMKLRYRVVGTTPGLELSVLQNLRRDLEKLVEAIRLRDPERAEEVVSRQMIALAEQVREMKDSPSADDVSNLSAVIGLLQGAGQAGAVIQSFRDQFNRPNLAVVVRESMVQSAINRGVCESSPVRECILGTRIIGNASLSGMVTADLLPSIGDVQIQVSLSANVSSQNTGYNGPIRLRTSGNGSVYVSRVLHISESGVVADPANVQASLNTQILAIEHHLRLVRRIARKKVDEQKPNADRIALAKLRSQVGGQFVEQTDSAAAITVPDMMAEIRPVLRRMSLDEPSRLLSSTDSDVFFDSTLRRHDQLASLISRPAIFEPVDAAVQIHESLIDNALTPLLAGRTLRETEFSGLIKNTGLPFKEPETETVSTVPVDGDGEEEEESEAGPFEIDFARLRPIIFEARDQTIRIGVRGVRFAQGKSELKKAMEITALYRPAKTDDGRVILLREDDVEVSFPGPDKRLSVSQTGIKRTIQKKFSKVFPAVLLDRSFEVPATAKLEALRGQTFRPEYVDARDGWLSVGVGSLNPQLH